MSAVLDLVFLHVKIAIGLLCLVFLYLPVFLYLGCYETAVVLP